MGVFPAVDQLRIERCYVSRKIERHPFASVYFATPQMIASRLRSKRGSASWPEIDLVVFDEAHHASAPQFMEAIKAVRASKQGSRAVMLGLSATPGRSQEAETEGLVALFRRQLIVSKQLGKRPVEALQDLGVLARLDFERIELERSWPGTVMEHASQRRLPISELETNVYRFDAAVRAILKVGSTDRVLVFTGSIDHAEALGAVLRSHGLKAEAISSRTGLDERDRILRSFQAGKIHVLLNKKLLATGYDCPAVRHAFLTVPIGSAILFEQIVGRASRGPAVGGNPRGTIWEIDNNLRINGYPSSYYRFRDFDWLSA